MRAADGKVLFGKWLPDLPTLDNPGLTEALNVLPVLGTYKPYLPLVGVADALSARPQGAASALSAAGVAFTYAGTATELFIRSGTGWVQRNPAFSTYSLTSSDYWRFAQFDTTLIATNYEDVPQAVEAGQPSFLFADLALTGTAPRARQVGIINRFVMLGDTVDGTNGAVSSRLQWSAIDDPTNWPVPGSANALSVQSGQQFMNSSFGPVTGIVSGEQFGIIFQRSGVARASYVGGDLVFQFNTIEENRGAICPNAIAKIGKLAYFIAADGFYVTDGYTVVPIGSGEVDSWFADRFQVAYLERVYAAVDLSRKLILWAFPGPGANNGRPNIVMVYNYDEKRWTHSVDECEVLASGLANGITLDDLDAYFASIDDVVPSLDSNAWSGGINTVSAFDTANKFGTFSGAAGSAVIEGQEVELNLGLYTRVQGIKPLVIGSAPIMTVALGRRDDLGTAITYSTDVAPTPRTGFCDFDSESRYNSSRLTITGNFDSAMGVLFQALSSGAT